MFGQASLVQIKDYFGMSGSQLRNEWAALSEEEKEFFKNGVGAVLEIPAS